MPDIASERLDAVPDYGGAGALAPACELDTRIHGRGRGAVLRDARPQPLSGRFALAAHSGGGPAAAPSFLQQAIVRVSPAARRIIEAANACAGGPRRRLAGVAGVPVPRPRAGDGEALAAAQGPLGEAAAAPAGCTGGGARCAPAPRLLSPAAGSA